MGPADVTNNAVFIQFDRGVRQVEYRRPVGCNGGSVVSERWKH